MRRVRATTGVSPALYKPLSSAEIAMQNEMPTDELSNDESGSTCAVLPEPLVEKPAGKLEWTGPRCEKCDAPLKSDVVTICRGCGWYASLGTFVEIDPNWETEHDDSEPVAAAPQKSHLQVWLDLMPRWSWVIIASVLVVVIESVVARLATPAGSSIRTIWSLTQLALGVFTVIGCHVFNFVVLAAEDADFGVMDIFLKPLKLWIRAVRNLPTRLWVADAAATGLTAAFMSLVVIGGIPYERLWDWGFEAPPKQELMGAVMDRVKELDSRNGADDLEEAIGDFAGSAEAGAYGDGFKLKEEEHREKADCVILGYSTNREGLLESLVLGAAHRGVLIYAGRVTPDLPDDERAALLQTLMSIRRRDPFIVMEADATWVEPKVTCRVSFGERLKGGKLRDIKWVSLLRGM
jgi:hypothetical protein